MPVQLHVHPARPLDDGVAADRIRKRGDDDLGMVGPGGADRRVHIGDEIAGPLGAERVRDRRLEAEDRQRAGRRQHQLGHGLARRRSNGENALLGRRAAERGRQAGDEPVEILRRYIDTRRVVLRGDGDARGGFRPARQRGGEAAAQQCGKGKELYRAHDASSVLKAWRRVRNRAGVVRTRRWRRPG